VNAPDISPANNPNAVIGGTTGIGGGALAVYLLNLVGLHIDAYGGAVIAGAVAAAALLIGRVGIRGALRQLWRGKK
jgi:hypothetical protein